MTLVIVILVLLLTLAFFYLKCSMMQSFMTLGSAVLATIIAFSYYEFVAELFISRGQGLDWALVGCFTVLFIAAFAAFRSISDFLIPSPIDLGNVVKLSISLVCGIFTGLIISGNLLVALGLLPMHGKVFYSQFDPDVPVVVESPRTPALSTDGFVTGLYSWISSGSMSSGKSFGVLHAEYLSQIHLNKLKTKDDVLSVCSQEAIEVPSKKGVQPVRTWPTPDDGELVVVRMGIKAGEIADGGAGRDVKFFPAQIRMIVKKAGTKDKMITGTATALYPSGFLANGSLIQAKLDETISPDPGTLKKGFYWLDVAFDVPQGNKPVLLQFKQNAVADLTSYNVVKSSPEIERALDGNGQEEGS